MSQRFKLTLEYDGAPFVGWQRQDNGHSVQAAVEEAVHAFSGERVVVHCAGRTDAGVHAVAQVAHFDLARSTRPDTVRDAVNHHLKPQPVAVIAAEEAPNDFHARFSATGRSYLYRIVNRRAPLVLDAGRAWWVPKALDAEAMAAAAQRLVGKHDFTSFRASECQADSPVKTLDHLEVVREGEAIEIYAAARSFLHHQVRNIAGTLKQIGHGRWAPEEISTILEARDRSAAGETAPADGLYLTGVRYD